MARPPKITEAERESGHYLSNKEMLAEWYICKEQGRVTDKFAFSLQLLAQRAARQYASKNHWFEDNVSNALLRMLVMWDKFNPEKSTNIFAYFTQVAKMEYFQLYHKNKSYVHVDLMIVTGEFKDNKNGS